MVTTKSGRRVLFALRTTDLLALNAVRDLAIT